MCVAIFGDSNPSLSAQRIRDTFIWLLAHGGSTNLLKLRNYEYFPHDLLQLLIKAHEGRAYDLSQQVNPLGTVELLSQNKPSRL